MRIEKCNRLIGFPAFISIHSTVIPIAQAIFVLDSPSVIISLSDSAFFDRCIFGFGLEPITVSTWRIVRDSKMLIRT